MSRSTRQAHYGAWRAVCALPTLLGIVLVLVTAFGWLGAWSGLILLGWLLMAAALLWRPIERAAARTRTASPGPRPAGRGLASGARSVRRPPSRR
jgi:hypothetical protein